MSSCRSRTLGLIGLNIAILVLPGCDGPDRTPVARDGPPNVVWILLDACRADHLSVYGYARKTSPNIDALAARGVLFERNYSQGPTTLLSVHNFMTGRYAAVAYYSPGAMNDWFLRRPPDGEVLVSTILRENGYDTAMFSSSPWYVKNSRLARSFEHYEWLRHDDQLTGDSYNDRHPELFAWLEEKASAAAPFFLLLHTLDTHGPRYTNNTAAEWLDPGFDPDRDAYLRRWDALVGEPSLSLSSADIRHLTDLYDGGIAYADSAVGEVLDALDRLGIRDNTWVIISSDHGELLGEDGTSLSHPPHETYDDLLHVPLILAGPGLPGNRRVAATTQNADVVPTLVDFLALNSPATFDGASLRPVIEGGPDATVRDYAVSQTQGRKVQDEPGRVVIFDDAKFDFSAFGDGRFPPDVAPRPAELVLAMPDTLLGRRPIAPTEQQRERAATVVDKRLVPLWKIAEAQPVDVPPWFRLQPNNPINDRNIADSNDRSDNLWSREPSRQSQKFLRDWIYVSSPWSENVAGLTFRLDIPNGTYQVSAYSAILPGDPPRASSFMYAVEQIDEEPRLARLPAPGDGAIVDAMIELGTYTITEGRFVLRVYAGLPEDNAVFGNLMFRTIGAQDSEISLEEIQERDEKLRALGYVE